MDGITTDSDGILIVGGYGHVGSRIASELKSLGHARIRIAGRDARAAERTASRLHCEHGEIDVDRPENWAPALAGMAMVIVCIDQKTAGFADHVLARGLIYIDITASDDFFRKVERLDDRARAAGGAAILSVGLAPGLTNLLVKACADSLDEADTARIGVMLGLGDEHGSAAWNWTIAQFATPQVQSAPLERVAFGPVPRTTSAVTLDFADQHVVRRTLDLEKAGTFLAFDPWWQSRSILFLMRAIARHPSMAAAAKRLIPYLAFGSRRAALAVEVSGQRNGVATIARATLEGHKEADITAAGNL